MTRRATTACSGMLAEMVAGAVCRRSCGDAVILFGTGSEVQLAMAAPELRAADGVAARVVSMPCREWFDEQDQAYRDSVFPPTVTARAQRRGGHQPGLAGHRRRRRSDRESTAATATTVKQVASGPVGTADQRHIRSRHLTLRIFTLQGPRPPSNQKQPHPPTPSAVTRIDDLYLNPGSHAPYHRRNKT